MSRARSPYERYAIKSFKHDGSLHRMRMENWLVPSERLHSEHADAGSVFPRLIVTETC